MLPGPGKRGHGFGDVDYIEQIDREDTMRILPNIGANLAIAMLSGASIVASSGEAHATGRNFDPGLQVAIIVCPIIPHENSHGLEARIGAPTKLISGELAEFNGETCADALAKIKGGLNGHCSTAAVDGALVATCDLTTGQAVDPLGSMLPYAAVITCPISLVADGTDFEAQFGATTVQINGMDDAITTCPAQRLVLRRGGGENPGWPKRPLQHHCGRRGACCNLRFRGGGTCRSAFAVSAAVADSNELSSRAGPV